MSSIFLSHNHKDKPFVRRLSERLRAHGIQTWVDEAEMRVGDSLISRIEMAIQAFECLGVVLSPHSVSSDWVRREVNIALTTARAVASLEQQVLSAPCEGVVLRYGRLYGPGTGSINHQDVGQKRKQ